MFFSICEKVKNLLLPKKKKVRKFIFVRWTEYFDLSEKRSQ